MSIPKDDAGLTRWIFSEPDVNRNASRWAWVDDWLLGDMRTLLLGAETATVQPTRNAYGGCLGRGNFSVAVLFTMGLEFLGRLHEGDTFRDKGYIPAYNVSQFMHHFQGHGRTLCSLLFEYTRNGLHHAFRPNRVVVEGVPDSTLGYVLTSHPERPSMLIRVGVGDFYVHLNAVDAVRALQAAVADYAEELRGRDPAPRRRFAEAFEAVECGYANRSCEDQCNAKQERTRCKQTIANRAVDVAKQLEIGRAVAFFSHAKYTTKVGGSVRIEGSGHVFEMERDDPQAVHPDPTLCTPGLMMTGCALAPGSELPTVRLDD